MPSLLPRSVLLALSPLAAVCAQETTKQPTNVLILVSDDQGWADIGYHNPSVYSPRLDALAASGARFTQQYVMPQCTPTRVALLTGRYPGRFGGAALSASNEPALPKGTRTLATWFGAHGYETFLCGKWHLGSTVESGPNEFGFANSYGSLAGAVGMYDHRYRKGKFADTWQRDGKLIAGHENGTHATDLVAAEAVRFLERKRDQPFFLYLAFHSVHTPLDERGRFVDRPTQLDPKRPGRWLDEDEIEWFHDPKGIIQREQDPEKRLLLAAVHHLDSAVGRVVDALERSGQGERTLLLFTSDNGPQGSWPGNAYPDDLKLTNFNQPLPMRGLKLDVYEGGIHVPAFAVWPGHIPAHEVDEPVHVVDWLPTLAALIAPGTDLDVDTDGTDIGGLLFATKPAPQLSDRELYWIWNSATDRWALRHHDWKIVHYGKEEPKQPADWALYDLAKDPREQNDVGKDHSEVLANMHQRFVRQRSRDRR